MSKGTDEKLAPQQRSAWFSFIKSIATFKGDLSSLTAPPFLLSPQSMVEFSTYWAEHPSLFVAPASEPDPEKRALLVLKWFLSTLKQQHNPKDESGKKKKLKPLNPFLGEIFTGKWEDEAGETKLVAEQVSHHPPATAFNVWNDKHGVRLQGHVAPKVYFSGTVHIDRKGYSILHLDDYNEDYLITMPKVHVEGLMTASLQPELSGSSFIRSSSGYTARIDYSCKGWLSGKRNSFSASLYHDDSANDPLYTAEGQWSDVYTFKDCRTGKIEKMDMNALPRTALQVPPIEEQHPLESRRAWKSVVEGINKGDVFAVGHEKTKIENEQRAMRKQEKSEGTEWSRRYFSRAKEDLVAERLAEGMKEKTSMRGDMDGAHGLWMWDEEKYRRAQNNTSDEPKISTRVSYDSGIGGMMMEPMTVEVLSD